MNKGELFRPWKLCTLGVGIALLIYGANYYNAPDWDATFSVMQAIETYATAAWSMRVFMDKRWRLIPWALLATWWVVDGSYYLYWDYMNPEGLEVMRGVNFWAALSMYMGMGIVWMWNGSLRELMSEIRRNFPLPNQETNF